MAVPCALVAVTGSNSKQLGNTSQKDFGTQKVYCVSNVTFHAESKYAIKIFPSPTVFVQWPFKLFIFRNFYIFIGDFFIHEQIF